MVKKKGRVYATLSVLILILLSLIPLSQKWIDNTRARVYQATEGSKNDLERFFVRKEGRAPDYGSRA